MFFRLLRLGVAAGALYACGASGQPTQPIFINGRAVLPVGDSLVAFTQAGVPGVLVAGRRTRAVGDTVGAGVLHSPVQLELLEDRWYVSDIDQGRPSIAIFTSGGERLERVMPLARFGATPHQFAVLPDGRVVIEAPAGQLLALTGDSAARFSTYQPGPRTGFLLGAAGGVFHAVPDRHLTLYNAFGNIRWRRNWPWAETAFITDLAVDAQGRIHVLAGVPGDGTFIVFTITPADGEVVRWSEYARGASFTIDYLGHVRPDTLVAN